jgi:hypothetical protein
MSVGFARISKGLFQRSIEQVVNNGGMRYNFLLALQNSPATSQEDWIDFLIDHGGLDRASASYVRDEWLRFWEPLGYAPDVVKEMLRQSLIFERSPWPTSISPTPTNPCQLPVIGSGQTTVTGSKSS